ncbi:major tail protein [Arthrobacter phage Sonali]|uniref:Major tail protein n=1 Tax=Arthrobacter phage Sonali TaxID=2510495 RepID=A0A411CQC5_9CAUD|nr:major tail protein [Arthrobacter phage Sonali]QAY16125.1 major tail protein [Arthrobacter phage Sonali]
MPNAVATPGSLQWLGIAKEVTSGTAIAAPTVWIPVDSPKYSPKVTTLTDQNLRGLMGSDFQQVQGMKYNEISYKTFIYQDSVYQHFQAMLGTTDAVTGTAPTVTHKTSLLNTSPGQTPSFTLFLAQGDKTVQIPGCSLQDLKFNGKANEAPSIEATWVGLPEAFITNPTNTPTTLAPYPPTTMSCTVGGNTALNKYTSVSIDFKRETAPVASLTGTAAPLSIYNGPLSVSGSLEAIYQGSVDNDLVNLLANTQPSLSVALTMAGDPTRPLTIQMSKVAYDSAEPAGSNTSWMTISSNFKALMNATDALDAKMSPAQVIFINQTVTPI